jgi:predicted house-cleaning NTP pyrophosphatase (Maf/HAM1 superfamily)
LEDKILGKPADPSEARQMLGRLRRQHYHYVYSGLTLALLPFPPTSPDPRLFTRLHQNNVWMRPYSDAEIEAYVNSGDPLDKAGAYAIQSKSFDPVEQLEGCFASVMGLPLRELLSMLREIGLSFPDISQRCAEYSGHPCCMGPTSQV